MSGILLALALGSEGAKGLGGAISLYGNYRASKLQARLAKLQGRIQANQFAAEAVGAETNALRLSRGHGDQEYETLRHQNAWIADMTQDAAMRGAAAEGSNAYLLAEQRREFARSNAYALLRSEREQADYMATANQSMVNAGNAIMGANYQAKSIRSAARVNLISGLFGAIGGGASSGSNQYMNYQAYTKAFGG